MTEPSSTVQECQGASLLLPVLPSELLVHVWRFLSSADLKLVRLVNKAWNSLCMEVYAAKLPYEVMLLEIDGIKNVTTHLNLYRPHASSPEYDFPRPSAFVCPLERVPAILDRVKFLQHPNMRSSCHVHLDKAMGNAILDCLSRSNLAPDALHIDDLSSYAPRVTEPIDSSSFYAAIARFHHNKLGLTGSHSLTLSCWDNSPTIDDRILSPRLNLLNVRGCDQVSLSLDGLKSWLCSDVQQRARSLFFGMHNSRNFSPTDVVPLVKAWKDTAIQTKPDGALETWNVSTLFLQLEEFDPTYDASTLYGQLKELLSDAEKYRNMENDYGDASFCATYGKLSLMLRISHANDR